MDTYLNNTPEFALETEDISKFRLQTRLIKPAFDEKKKKDPAFRNMTCSCFAAKIGIGESTWKKLYNGQANDAMCSTVWAIAKPLGISVAALFGLDSACVQPSTITNAQVEDMQRRIAADTERIRFKDERIAYLERHISASVQEQDRLRKLFHEEGLKRTRAEEHAASLEAILKTRDESISKHDEVRNTNKNVIDHLTITNKRNRIISTVMTLTTVILAGLMIYFLWELQNPHSGNWQF